MRIDPVIRNLSDAASQVQKTGDAVGTGAGSFADQLKTRVDEVNQLQVDADKAMSEGAVGGASDIHETMIQLEKAELGLRYLTKFRNKALEAYNEVMRMQF